MIIANTTVIIAPKALIVKIWDEFGLIDKAAKNATAERP